MKSNSDIECTSIPFSLRSVLRIPDPDSTGPLDLDPDPRRQKMTRKKEKREFNFLKCWIFFMGAVEASLLACMPFMEN
jgi:hypothetical protein